MILHWAYKYTNMAVDILKDNSISIGFGEGIGQSTLTDFTDMLGVNTDDAGVISSEYSFNVIRAGQANSIVTFNDSTSIITLATGITSYRGVYTGRAIKFSTTGTLPTGITAGTIYYISVVDGGLQTFKVADTLKKATDGSAFTAFSGSGTGTHTVEFIEPSAISYWTKNKQGKYFALDDNGRVWFFNYDGGVGTPPYLISGNTTSQPNGIIYYKGYILVFSASDIDALLDIQSTTDTITWTLNFQSVTINTGQNANVFLSLNDDSIYFYNGSIGGRYHQIGLLEENVGQTFNPASGTTFSMVADVVTVPFDDYNEISSINELSSNLLISSNAGNIYFWDKKSPSFTSYISISEKNIDKVVVSNNFAYVFAGNVGNVYVINTSSADLFFNIPKHLLQNTYQDGVDNVVINYATIIKNNILFSASIITNDLSPNQKVNSFIGKISLTNKKFTKLSSSSFGQLLDRNSNQLSKINSILPIGENLIISTTIYSNSTSESTYYIESNLTKFSYDAGLTFFTYNNNYRAYAITGLISYGGIYSKKTLKELNISLARELTTGQGIKISYRRNDISSWTVLKEINYTLNGAIKDIKIEAPITDIIDIQFKIELSGYVLINATASATSTTPYLKLVRLIP